MGIEKSQFKMAVAHDLGSSFDDALELAQADIHKWAGAKTAFKEAGAAIDKLLAHIAQDVKEGKMEIEASNAAQDYIRKAVGLCDNLRLSAEVREQRAHGRVEGLKTVVKITKSYHDKEKSKAEALLAVGDDETALVGGAEATRRPPARPTGARPANTVGAMKQAEKAG